MCDTLNDTDSFTQSADTVAAIRTFVQYFESANNVTIVNHELVNDVVKSGDNFCSGILRLLFAYRNDQNQTLNDSVLLKIPSLGSGFNDVRKTNIYDNEIRMYEEVLPQMYALWVGEPFSPAFYAVTDAKVLILEDLTAKGFRKGGEKLKLDLEHGRVALAALARYHAVSVKYLQRVGHVVPASLIEPIKATIALENHSTFLLQRLLTLNEANVSKTILDKVRDYKGKLVSDCAYRISVDNDSLTVVTHGDFWGNNILFSYDDEGRVHKARIVDWQISRKGSPVVDIIYFFVTGLQFDVFEANRDELLDTYLNTLNHHLSTLNCGCSYSRTLLDRDMESYKSLYLNLLITAVPLALIDKTVLFSEAKIEDVPRTYLDFVPKWLNYLERTKII